MSQLSDTNNNCRCVDHYYDRKPKLKLQTQTTNKAFYKPLPIQKPQQFQPPKVQQKHYDPEVLQTSYKSQYNAPKPSESQLSQSNYSNVSDYMKRKPQVPFYSDTAYKDHYKPMPVVKQKQPTYQYKPKNTKFEGQSSYKAQFLPKKNQELINAGNNIANSVSSYLQRKPKVKFQGSSAYKETFKPHQVKVQRQPEYKYSKNPSPFQGQSSYKQAFKQLPKQAYKGDVQHCPVHPGKIAIK